MTTPVRWGLLLIATLATTVVATSFAGCGDAAAPLTVSPESAEFGRVRRGTFPRMSFTIRNNLEEATVLRAPQKSCSCIRFIELPRRNLRPGEETKMVIELVSDFGPPIKLKGKRITLSTGHGDAVIIPVEADIYSPYWLKNDRLGWGRVTAQHREAKVAEIHVESGFDVKLAAELEGFPGGVNLQHARWFDVEVKPSTNPSSQSLFVHIRPKAEIQPTPPRGAFASQARIGLEVVGEGVPKQTVFVTVQLKGHWAL